MVDDPRLAPQSSEFEEVPAIFIDLFAIGFGENTLALLPLEGDTWFYADNGDLIVDFKSGGRNSRTVINRLHLVVHDIRHGVIRRPAQAHAQTESSPEPESPSNADVW